MSKWQPREIKDIDKACKFPEKKWCPRHGTFYAVFCLKCKLEEIKKEKRE